MILYCFECNGPIEVDENELNESFISPEICFCPKCFDDEEDFLNEGEKRKITFAPKIPYKELRVKENEEIAKHRWFESERVGYQVEQDYAETDWRKKFEDDFLKRWGYQ